MDARVFDMAAIAAFTTCANGGLIPHAKQGGKGVRALAKAGSKLEGTGFENEHIGQTQVALEGRVGRGAVCPSETVAGVCCGCPGAAPPRASCFVGLGQRVILGDDLRKPAYVYVYESAQYCIISRPSPTIRT